jgi:hypothetical protein
MGISLACSADVHANGRTYTVTVTNRPADGTGPEHIEVELMGVDPDGTQSASGTLALPQDGLAAVGKLLNQIMTGLSTLNGRSSTGPTNAQAPWTKGQDADLLERWLAASETRSAHAVRRELAVYFGRSAGSIRARLLRIGCDPDAPGHAFIPVPDSAET